MIISPCVLLVPAATDKESMSHPHKHRLTPACTQCETRTHAVSFAEGIAVRRSRIFRHSVMCGVYGGRGILSLCITFNENINAAAHKSKFKNFQQELKKRIKKKSLQAAVLTTRFCTSGSGAHSQLHIPSQCYLYGRSALK